MATASCRAWLICSSTAPSSPGRRGGTTSNGSSPVRASVTRPPARSTTPAAAIPRPDSATNGTIHGHTFPFGSRPRSIALAHLDEVEGAVAGLYQRTRVTTGRGLTVWSYAYGGGLDLVPIPSGSWRAHARVPSRLARPAGLSTLPDAPPPPRLWSQCAPVRRRRERSRGNHVAYRCSEVIAIYPITPGLSDGRGVRHVVGRRGAEPLGHRPRGDRTAVRGRGRRHAARRGACAARSATTFTASQGLLLMLPNMFKIAGELTPAVIHVAARSIATHALSIFGDHSDVMAARTTGWAMLCAGIGPGGRRLRAHLPRRDAREPGAVPALLRRVPHLARDRRRRASRRQRLRRP